MAKSIRTFYTKVENELTDEMLNDFLIAAFYDGISYWCDRIVRDTVRTEAEKDQTSGDYLIAGGKLRLHDMVEDQWRELTLEMLINGIRETCEYTSVSLQDLYDNHDADTADRIVQFAVLGEQVYG